MAGFLTEPSLAVEPGVTAAGTSWIGDNLVLVKYNSSGTAQWAQTVSTGAYSSYFNTVATDGNWHVYAAGYINGTGTYNFGGSVRAAGTYGGDNVVLVKYSE